MRSCVRPLSVDDLAGVFFEHTLALEEGLHASKRLVAAVHPAKWSLVIYRVESCGEMAIETPSLPLAIEHYNEL
jgi:hypothetical protein